jgi:hypothetical protein
MDAVERMELAAVVRQAVDAALAVALHDIRGKLDDIASSLDGIETTLQQLVDGDDEDDSN